jgi:putative hemolysin
MLGDILGSIGILFALILVNGALSATEIAISSVNRTKVKMKAESGDKKAKKLYKALEDPTSFFATTQIYITFIAFLSGAYASSVFAEPLIVWIMQFENPIPQAVVEPIIFIVITTIFTYFAIVFGELVPKRIALKNPFKFASYTSGFLSMLSAIAMPFVKLLAVSALFVLKLLGIKKQSGDDGSEEGITNEEILLMVDSGGEAGSIAERDRELLSRVLHLEDRLVKDACVHRIDVVAMPIESTYDEITDVLASEKCSRIPIFEETIDNVVGILHLKDMFKYMADNSLHDNFNLKSLLREPYFVPAFKKTGELFREMQVSHLHMAIVVDEYGGTIGVVTAEDLVEEVVVQRIICHIFKHIFKV